MFRFDSIDKSSVGSDLRRCLGVTSKDQVTHSYPLLGKAISESQEKRRSVAGAGSRQSELSIEGQAVARE